MADKFDDYTESLTALVRECIRCSPESWDKGRLTIQCDGHRIDYQLKNVESEGKAVISKELAQLCEDYWGAFMRSGEPWLESEIEFLQVEGKWTFNAQYKYTKQTVPAVQASKPFWKFWH